MTDLETLSQELQALKKRYAVMVEQAPEAIVVFDLDDGHFVEVNGAACRLYGLDRERLFSTGPVEMSPAIQPGGTASGVAAQTLIERALVAGEPVEFDWMHVDAAGNPLPCRIQLAQLPVPRRRLVRAVIHDQRGYVESEKARERLLRILEESSDLIGMATADGRCLFINPSGRAQLAIPSGESIEGQSISGFYPPEAVQDVLGPALEQARRTGRWQGTGEMLGRDGRRFPVSQVIIAHTDDQGDVAYLSTIARDISTERDIEQAQKLESLGILAGGIAHDFNNLLVGILGNAGLMLADLPQDSPLHSLAKRIETAALHAADLATQMLAYAGKATPELSVFDLSALVPELEDLLHASISKKARLVTEFASEPPLVRGDRTQLRQILMNLVLNASEALEDEPGNITVRTGRERPPAGEFLHDFLPDGVRNKECVYLEVADTGAGIEPADVERIFEPFFTTKFTGRGLGLAALLGIARTHHAAITVDARPGEGTRFRVWFQPAAAEFRPAPAVGLRSESMRAGGRVLLVEDEPSVRAVMRSALEDAGLKVHEAADGVAGLGAFKSDSEGFDVVVLDMTMPRLSGEEVLTCIRAIAPAQPVVLTSGYSAGSVASDDFTHFLPKPFRPSELQDIVALASGHGDEG